METVEMITPDPRLSGLMLPESEIDEEMMIGKNFGLVVGNPANPSGSHPLLMRSVMPADMWVVRGMDTYDEGFKEQMTKWLPEKERSIRSMLESLELDEAEKMKAKNHMPDESISLVADAVPKAAEGGKRKKKVLVTIGQEHMDYMMKHPLPPPNKPNHKIRFFMIRDALDMFYASEEAAYKEQQRIFEDYRRYGYAVKEYEVDYDFDEEEEEV